VDPKTGIVYETEDNGDNSGLYRFVPNSYGDLTSGKLQMLAIDGVPKYDTRRLQVIGKKWPVTWVDIPNPNPPGTGGSDVFNQGFNAGGARFRRLEGIWYGDNSFFFNATDGGDIPAGDDQGRGQVWEFRPSGNEGGWLTLIFESPSINVLNMPDNISVSPSGGLVLCEDGGDAPTQFLRGVTPGGQIFDFASNN
jgi:secreted PhoX family phosphatase